MAFVTEIVDSVFNPNDCASVIVWPGVLGPRYGTYTTFSDRSWDDSAGYAETDWASATEAGQALAERHGFSNVYVVPNLRTELSQAV